MSIYGNNSHVADDWPMVNCPGSLRTDRLEPVAVMGHEHVVCTLCGDWLGTAHSWKVTR